MGPAVRQGLRSENMASGAKSGGVKAEPKDVEPALSTQDIGRRAAAGAALLTAKGGVAQVLGLLSTIVVTRMLAPSELGLYAIALTVSTFLLMLTGGIGMAGGLIRRSVAPDDADLRAYVALQLGLTSLLLLLVALVTLPLGLVGKLTVVMVASAPIAAFRGAGALVLERRLLYKRLATAETAETIVYYGWTIVTVAIGWGLWGLATATVARAVVGTSCVVALSPVGLVWPRFDWGRIRAIIGIGVRVQAIDVIVSLRDQVLVLGTAVVGSVSIVAFWGLVLRLLQAPAMLLWTLVRVSFPAMSRAKSAGGDPGTMLPKLLPAATILAGTLLIPLAGAPAIVPLLFGERWSPAADALTLACLAVVIHTPMMISGQAYLWTSGNARTPLRAMVTDAVICVGIGLPLVPILGVLGLAIAGVAAAVCHTAILARAVDRELRVGVFRQIGTPIGAWVAAAGLAWACSKGPGPLVLRAALSVFVGGAVYFGLLFFVRRTLMVELGSATASWIRRHLLRREALRAQAAPSAHA